MLRCWVQLLIEGVASDEHRSGIWVHCFYDFVILSLNCTFVLSSAFNLKTEFSPTAGNLSVLGVCICAQICSPKFMRTGWISWVLFWTFDWGKRVLCSITVMSLTVQHEALAAILRISADIQGWHMYGLGLWCVVCLWGEAWGCN